MNNLSDKTFNNFNLKKNLFDFVYYNQEVTNLNVN